MKKAVALVFIGSATLTGCLPDRDLLLGPSNDTIPNGIPKIWVNEISSNGSVHINEFGVAEDWFELFNPAGFSVTLEQGEWFVTDAAGSENQKFALPRLTIPARGFLMIWCDGMDTVGDHVHTNFKLSSAGETVGIYHVGDGLETEVDVRAFPPTIPSGSSEGRYPDGGPDWVIFSSPTPGEGNQ